MNSVNARSLTLRYTLALGLVGLCTLGSHLILTHVLYDRDGSAYIINMTGRQRMLSQRISSLAAQRVLGDEGVNQDLIAAIQLFDDNFRRLRGELGHKGLDAIYVGQGLANEVGDYVALARKLSMMSPNDPSLRNQANKLFNLSRTSLIRKLDAVVNVH